MQTPPVGDSLTIGLAQIAPIWLDRDATLAKIVTWVEQAATLGCHLVAFGEALLPGYPFWLGRTDGARFDSPLQKEIHAHYLDQAIQIEAGHLAELCRSAAAHEVTVMLGTIERAADRGGHSLYCSLVTIDASGTIVNVHRKLTPTYEERLAWSPGDGHGLRVQAQGKFTVGGLNCWENWMPLSRAALYGQGEDLHVAVWPGNVRNTEDITRFIARESRSYVASVSGLMRPSDVPEGIPGREAILADCPDFLANGGTCLAGPDGHWVIEPCPEQEKLLVATIDHRLVRQERQNFDPSGHYSRPDVTRLKVQRRRQSVLKLKD